MDGIRAQAKAVIRCARQALERTARMIEDDKGMVKRKKTSNFQVENNWTGEKLDFLFPHNLVIG